MANIFSEAYNRIVSDIANRVTTEMGRDTVKAREYRRGYQPKQLKVRPNQYDDNIQINFVGLIANRAVSQLIGHGISLRFDGEDGGVVTPQGEFVRSALCANHEEILFHRACLSACEAGTGYLFLLPPDTIYDDEGNGFPRILAWDPALVTMRSLPQDFDVVVQYTHEYFIPDQHGRNVGYRKVVERDMAAVNEVWTITDYKQEANSSRWEQIAPPVIWPYPFCPVLHWQNLPSIDCVYGEPDITQDVIALQDRINGNASNVAKVLRLNGHPFMWGKGLQSAGIFDQGPDKIVSLGPDGEISSLPPVGDMVAAREYLDWLRASLFDITRTVDINSMKDKLGSLTNFALKVLYQDNLNKINTKRELFGDALEALAYRLQIMGGMQPLDCEIDWPEFLPVNGMETAQLEQMLVGMGIESKQSAAEGMGLDWSVETERIQNENTQSDNIGAALLRAFNRNGETPPAA